MAQNTLNEKINPSVLFLVAGGQRLRKVRPKTTDGEKDLKLQIFAAAALANALAGCADTPDLQPPQDVVIKNPGITQNRILGFTEPVLRTFVRETQDEAIARTAGSSQSNTEPKAIEVTGLRCVADSAEMRAEVITPGIVRLPVFKGRPTPLRMNCTGPGYTGEMDLVPTLDGVVIGAGSAAGLVAAAITAGIAASNDKWSYGRSGTNLSVTVEPTSP